MRATLIMVLTLAPVAGCGFYFDDDDCLDQGAPASEFIGYRNPYTGSCEDFGGGGGGCGPVPQEDGTAAPDWAVCYSECTDLGEDACLGASGCRAVYVSDCPEGLDCANTTYTYAECWATAPSGPIQGGGCSGLDAYQCSRHDDCAAYHYQLELDCTGGACDIAWPTPGNFETCAPEPDRASSCYGEVICREAPPECPAGTVPGIVDGCYDGSCIAFDQCDPPIDPGSCYGEVTCESLPPTCPSGSVPGVADSCWTGYCVPEEQCEQPVPCGEIANEPECVERADCAPTYLGVDCTCDDNGDCSCADWLFEECRSGVQPFYRVEGLHMAP